MCRRVSAGKDHCDSLPKADLPATSASEVPRTLPALSVLGLGCCPAPQKATQFYPAKTRNTNYIALVCPLTVVNTRAKESWLGLYDYLGIDNLVPRQDSMAGTRPAPVLRQDSMAGTRPAPVTCRACELRKTTSPLCLSFLHSKMVVVIGLL